MNYLLRRGEETIELDYDLRWIDEFGFSRVQQGREFSLTGAILIDEAEKQAGRPITLQPEDESSGWMTRADAKRLKDWAADAGQALVLSIDGEEFNVTFRVDEDQAAVTATPIVFTSNPTDADPFAVTLRFITV